ncbi:hypothetical protein [Paractinoplanes rishiriensis]|uniref:Uncharacterized protein n=1 Tax=Paractinoplanes rishiriensis TaxID=1050105 RepID=A0A919JT84_9ACTN|nr:hypothetical protein [Actinoplanes rishiriensis]GIE92927.1 hypothetical protein Ari01nite_03920 [Actinoplanes rishiriensis]
MRKSRNRNGARLLTGGALATATAAAAVFVAPAAALAATNVTLTPTPSVIGTQGGTSVGLAGTGAFLTSTTYTARLIGGTGPTCAAQPAAVNPSATNPVYNAGTLTRVGDNAATLVTAPVPAGAYKLCTYGLDPDGIDAGSDPDLVSSGLTSGVLTAVPFAPLSAVTGTTAGGNQITMVQTNFIGTNAAVGTIFTTTGTCPEKYTSSGNITATSTKTNVNTATITVPTTLTSGTGYTVCVYNGVANNTSVLLGKGHATYSTYATTLPSATLTPSAGSSGGGNFITVALPLNTLAGPSPIVLFTRNSCPATDPVGTPTDPFEGTVTKISSGKVAVEVPAEVEVVAHAATSPWLACIYGADEGAIVAQPALYTVAPVLEVADAETTTGAGPAQGGTTVTFTDLEGIPTSEGATLKASLGGSPLNNVKALNDTSITGVTTPHAPGPVTLSITTAAGTKTTAVDLVTPLFTYEYGITVTPNLLPFDENTTIDIMGAGFTGLTFGALATDKDAADAHIMLTDNVWTSQDFSVDLDVEAESAVSECEDVLPIGDDELICTMVLEDSFDVGVGDFSLTGDPVPAGVYTVTVVNTSDDLNEDDYNYSVVSSGSTVTVATF